MPALLDPPTTLTKTVPTLLGDIRLTCDGEFITGLYLPNHDAVSDCGQEATPPNPPSDKGGNRTASTLGRKSSRGKSDTWSLNRLPVPAIAVRFPSLSEGGLGGVNTHKHLSPPSVTILQEAARQLSAYFAGNLRSFDLPLRLSGTPFQQQVWEELTRIPFGETISYAELARRIGNPNACRAVGLANGRNPVSIIVPCHRVIGSNGTLTGYGGGLPEKKWLLEHETNSELGTRNSE